VVITDPNRDKGYYASQVAAPVFKAISDRIWATMIDTAKQLKPKKLEMVGEKMKPMMIEDQNILSKKLPVKRLPSQRLVAVPPKGVNVVPDLTGMGLKDAIFILENMGLSVKIIGRGVIAKQSIAPGTHITKGTEIIIELM
jgi:cell division protein FtsI (penicillin-binding protein 3)